MNRIVKRVSSVFNQYHQEQSHDIAIHNMKKNIMGKTTIEATHLFNSEQNRLLQRFLILDLGCVQDRTASIAARS